MCFINNHYGLFDHQAKVTQKVRKSVNNKNVFQTVFYLLRANLHIYNLSIYLEQYTEAVLQTLLLKKEFCYRFVTYPQRNTRAELLHGCSPVNCLNIRRAPFLKNTSVWLLLYIWQWIQHVPTGIYLFKVKIEKLQSTKLTIKTPTKFMILKKE